MPDSPPDAPAIPAPQPFAGFEVGSVPDRLINAEAVAMTALTLIANPCVWHALHAAATAARGGLLGDQQQPGPSPELVQDLALLTTDPDGCTDALLSLETLDATVRAWRVRTERTTGPLQEPPRPIARQGMRVTGGAAGGEIEAPAPTHPAGGQA